MTRGRTDAIRMIALVFSLFLSLDSPTRATIPGPPPEGLVVSSLLDPPFPNVAGTLRNAINQINAGVGGTTTIVIAVDGVLKLTQPLPTIEADVEIVGPGAHRFLLSRDLDTGRYRLLTIGQGRNVKISGITLAGGDPDDLVDGDGGAILNNGALALEKCVFAGSIGRRDGGAVFTNGHLTVEECLFQDNLAIGNGGAICTGSVDGARLIVRNSAFLNNTAFENGGAIHHAYGRDFGEESFLLNCTFSENLAEEAGGAVSNVARDGLRTLLNLFNCTVRENTGESCGGGIYCRASDGLSRIILNNCIVAGNISDFGTDIELDESAELFRDRVNLIGVNDRAESPFPIGQPNINGDYVGSLLAPLDPKLQPLGDHGGFTPTYEPNLDSFAVDPPTNIAPLAYSTDQRGMPRFQDGDCDASMTADIGAHELDDYRAGNVNLGTGLAADVLRVNECTEEVNRVVEVGVGEPITVSLDSSPSGPAAARYFLLIWLGGPASPTDFTTPQGSFGKFVNPTPLAGGVGPQPFKCLASSDLPASVCGGAREDFSPFRAPWSVTRASGLTTPGLHFTLQGLLADSGSANPLPFSITNAVGIQVTP